MTEPAHPGRARGFSLIELLVALAIAAILAAAAVAAYDFANVMNFKTALLYFRPLPYELQFKKYGDETLIYIN